MSDNAVWIDQPNDADPAKLLPLGITDPYFDGRWLERMGYLASLPYLQKVRAQFGHAGIFLCSQGQDNLGSWLPAGTTTPENWALWANNLVQKAIAPGTGGDFPRVDLNLEAEPAWVLSTLQAWRKHQPRRTTFLSVQAHKATLFKSLVPQLVELGVVVRPECYVGSMQRVESANEILAWADAGYPLSMIQPFLDGASLGAWWGEHGACVFTQGRIPA